MSQRVVLMTDNCDIRIYGDRMLFNLKGRSVEDHEMGLRYAFDRLSQEQDRNSEAFLQTFVDVTHRDELDFFLRNGFFVHNIMLFMEADLERAGAVLRNRDEIDASGKILTGSDIKDTVIFEEYDHSADLSEYLEANALGFGEQDPEEMIREELSNPKAKIYVTRIKGKIASSVTVWETEPGIYSTENIFTVPEFREKHLASAMLKRTLMTLLVNGAKKVRLSVFGDDLEALGLYYGLGYELKAEKYELIF